MTTCKNCVKFKTAECWCDENKVKETDPICLKFVGFKTATGKENAVWSIYGRDESEILKENPPKCVKVMSWEEYKTREERIGKLNELIKQVKNGSPADWWDLYREICNFL